jgi:hypothetical protein
MKQSERSRHIDSATKYPKMLALLLVKCTFSNLDLHATRPDGVPRIAPPFHILHTGRPMGTGPEHHIRISRSHYRGCGPMDRYGRSPNASSSPGLGGRGRFEYAHYQLAADVASRQTSA